MISLYEVFLCVYLSGLVFAELSGSVVWYLLLLLEHSKLFLLQVFLLFLSLLVFFLVLQLKVFNTYKKVLFGALFFLLVLLKYN